MASIDSVFAELDKKKQADLDRWVFDHLPLTDAQKVEFVHMMKQEEEKQRWEEEHEVKKLKAPSTP